MQMKISVMMLLICAQTSGNRRCRNANGECDSRSLAHHEYRSASNNRGYAAESHCTSRQQFIRAGSARDYPDDDYRTAANQDANYHCEKYFNSTISIYAARQNPNASIRDWQRCYLRRWRVVERATISQTLALF